MERERFYTAYAAANVRILENADDCVGVTLCAPLHKSRATYDLLPTF